MTTPQAVKKKTTKKTTAGMAPPSLALEVVAGEWIDAAAWDGQLPEWGTVRRVVYVSGPMRAIAELNYPSFNRAASYLADQGFEVINPADLPADTPVADALRIDYQNVARADIIAFMPGWQGSEGARAEYAIARSLGLDAMVMSAELDSIVFEGTFGQMSDAHLTPIEDEAWRLVYGDRGQSYGNPTADFGRTANAWSDLFGTELDPLDVAKAMISLKLSRLTHKPHHWDSWTDIIGYALCAQRIINGV